jgi:hypothetical protein
MDVASKEVFTSGGRLELVIDAGSAGNDLTLEYRLRGLLVFVDGNVVANA